MSVDGVSDDRGRSEQPGIVSRHCFSAGPYYDPDRMSFGPLIGVDEHTVAPGAGFDWHAHRGVHIVSWVLDGTLRHEDSNGETRLVSPGVALVQSTGDGIRHTETNASDVDPLRFLQITILADGPADVRSATLPTTVAGVTVDVRHAFPGRFPSFALVVRGDYAVESAEPIRAGASFCFEADDHLVYDGDPDARLLVVEFDGSSLEGLPSNA